MPLHVSSTMCSPSGGQNCYTASGVITPVGGRPVHRLREEEEEDDEKSLLSTCAPDGHLQVRRYQMLYNTILTS